jgi:CHASE3 domain sensor protein
MIRKAALQIAGLGLLAFMAFNGYLAIHHLRQIQKNAALTLEGSAVQANITGVSQDLTDMETGQRGYLLTGDPAYLQPYTEAKARIENHFAGLRSELANRAEQERSVEAQLESLAGSKEAEMEWTINLRQQGYRHRAFQLVNTNEGKEYMDHAQGLLSFLNSTESRSLAKVEEEKNATVSKAWSRTVEANLFLLILTACLFGLIRYHERGIEREAAHSRRMLAVRDAQLEKLTSALSNQTRSEISIIEENARLLLERYGGFLPRQGSEYAEQIKEAAAKMERLRKVLVDEPVSAIEEKAA